MGAKTEKIPYMKMFWADYLTDTRRLTPEQHGAYLLLIATMWTEQSPVLPNDRKVLCRVTGVTPNRWPSVWAGIEHFFTVTDAEIRHNRVAKELNFAQEKRIVRAASGKLGGEANALKNKEAVVANATANATANALASSTESRVQKDNTPLTPLGGNEGEGPKPRKSKAEPKPWFEPYFDKFWTAWPHKQGRKAARLALWKAWGDIPPDQGYEASADGRLATLTAAVAAYEAWRVKMDYKPCHAATWLNGGRWADDYGTGPTKATKERFAL